MSRDEFGVIAVFLFFIVVALAVGFDTGRHRGYNQAVLDMAEVTPPPKTTDQQCVAWLFDVNMRDVKKRICK